MTTPMAEGQEKALVVLSGGQDSTTCLFWALDRFGRGNVATLSFDYGQRHRIELESAARVAKHAAVSHICLPMDTFAVLGGNALTDSEIVVDNAVSAATGLPNTFVPGRNLVFLTFAAAYAYQRGIANLVIGVAQADYSGYPDCREETMRALQDTLRKGMDSEVTIHTPLMHLSKKQTVELAEQLGCLAAMALTHTCYKGERPPCGKCSACELRAKGFAEAGFEDPLLQV